MSNSNINQMVSVPAKTSQNYHIVDFHKETNKNIFIYMSYLTEDEEEQLDKFKGDAFELIRGEKTFYIARRQIYCYGEVDFKSEEDCKQIEKFDFLNYLEGVGVRIYSNYNYEHHCYYSDNKHLRWTETWNPLKLCKIAHGALGKPKRIILFKQVYDTVQKKRSR